MKDTIIKGAGNSRTIKSVPNFSALYPTWESFRDAIGTNGIPIDLLGLAAAGVNQMGTALNKAALLSDSTASAIGGLGSDPTPDQALARLRTLITTAQNTANDAKARLLKVGHKTRSGTGTTNYTVELNGTPYLAFISRATNKTSYNSNGLDGVVAFSTGGVGGYMSYATVSDSAEINMYIEGSTLVARGNRDYHVKALQNTSGTTYHITYLYV